MNVIKYDKNRNFRLKWYVMSTYDFVKYPSEFYTELPINPEKGLYLRIDDGLSQYLAELGIAEEFNYMAEWHETFRF
jgi:hypothetical protein